MALWIADLSKLGATGFCPDTEQKACCRARRCEPMQRSFAFVHRFRPAYAGANVGHPSIPSRAGFEQRKAPAVAGASISRERTAIRLPCWSTRLLGQRL